MTRIKLTGGFSLCPEGEHVFRITGVDYKEAFGRMEVAMETEGGVRHRERFSLMGEGGEVNEGAMNAFSFFARTAMNDFSLQEVDHAALVGRYIRCEIVHNSVSGRDGQERVFANIGNKWPADGFGGGAAGVDLDALLG